MPPVEIKKKKIVQVTLTKYELLHLRDLMSITLPPDGSHTVSSSLAATENRQFVESILWKKISEACMQAGLPVGEEAPDYIVSPTGMTPLGVFQVSSDPMGSQENYADDEDDEDDENSFEGQ